MAVAPAHHAVGTLNTQLRRLSWGAGALAAAAAAGYALASGDETVALALGFAPLVVWLTTRPRLLLVPLGLSLPLVFSLTGGTYEVSIADLLLAVLGVSIAVEGAVTDLGTRLRCALLPLAAPVSVYLLVVSLTLVAHLDAGPLAATAQRIELLVLPLVVGAYAVLRGHFIGLLRAYVLGTSVLACIWPLADLGVQKNPAGQLIANAILLLVGVPQLRRLLPLLLALVPGLLLTQSRGAIVVTAIGLIVLTAMHGFRARPLVTRVVPIVILAAVAFAFMPSALRERVTTLRAGADTPAAHAISIRQEFSRDARRIIDANPWTGVGLGNYSSGAAALGLTQIEDPHQVLLLEAAEGGYLLAGAFILLVLGSCLALVRLRNVPIAPAAAAVLAATAVHGLVDVYWVRGTPLLGWLLAGMACAAAVQRRGAERAS
jgi:hypothetical protein